MKQKKRAKHKEIVRRLRSVVLAAVLLCITLCSESCTQSSAPEPAPEPGSREEQDGLRIGMIFDTFVVERWIRDRDAFLATAADLGATVDITNANGDIERQSQMIRHYTEQGFDAIVIVAIDSAPLKEAIEDARNAGIPVICYDRLIRDVETDFYISFDNREVGRLMAQESLSFQQSPEDEVLLILGPRSDNNTLQVEEGIRELYQESAPVKVLDTTFITDWDAEEAARYVEEHLELVKEAEVIICGNDNFAGSVIRTLSANRIPLPGIVGQDADLDACQRIVEGTQQMTVFKPVHLLAQEAAQIAVALAKGEQIEADTSLSNGTQDIPSRLLTPIAVTADNMEETIIESGFHTRDEVYLNVR